MNLRALRYFVAIVDAGSVTAAADTIAIAQPALSRQLRELEADVGVQLLVRGARGVRLTAAGLTLYESAQRMLREATRVKEQLAVSPKPGRSVVTLGVSPTIARLVLPGIVETCLDSLPSLTLKAKEAFSPELLAWVERGVIDLAILTNPQPTRGLAMYPLLAEPFALISNAQLNLPRVVDRANLADIPLLMTNLHRNLVERQLLSLGEPLHIRAEIDSVDTIRELVAGGQWATIMPISAFKDAGKSIRASEISGASLSRLLVIAKRIETAADPMTEIVQQMVHDEFARLGREHAFTISHSTIQSAPHQQE